MVIVAVYAMRFATGTEFFPGMVQWGSGKGP